jgi:cob(I)alamin adenosyltransferase
MLNGNKGKQGKNKKGGKQSEEIAKMAAQQERIRNRLNEIRNELSGDQNSKNNIDKLLQDMEKTQSDIINNNITQSTLLRQEQIMNRLLEAEKAQLERDKEKQRESNEWLNNLSKKLIDPYQEYIQKKKKQEELIKTIPPSFTPFYKNKVNQYFKNEQ